MSDDGAYSYGMKWQCVEFVRRFYKEYFDMRCPKNMGMPLIILTYKWDMEL